MSRTSGLAVVSIVLMLGQAVKASQEACADLAGDKQDAITKYLQARYNIPQNIGLQIVKNTVVEGTCYRKIDI